MTNKYEWDLQAILENKTFEEIYSEWKQTLNEVVNTYKTFYVNVDSFRKFCQLELKLKLLNNKVSNYINNNLNENIVNSTWNEWHQKMMYDVNDFGNKISDFTNIVLKNSKKIKLYLLMDEFKKYNRQYYLIFKSNSHTLSPIMEKAISKISINNGATEDIFSTLTDNDLIFNDAIDSQNKKHSINNISDVMTNLKSNDRRLRKTSWISYNSTYYSYRNTLTKTLYYNYLMLNSWSKLHNYDSYLDNCLKNDEIKEKLLLNLYAKVELYKKLYIQYQKVRNRTLKKQLNLTKLNPWDKSVDLSVQPIKFTIEQAQTEVLAALKPLGEKYVNNAKKAFDENWISWLPKKGKQTGAYSIGQTYGLKKIYISMNFTQDMNSVSTLIHELGHAMHSYEFNQKQDIYADCSIFYAEISSIVNEVLLVYYWMDKYKNDKIVLKNVLDHFLKNFFATTTRQILFSNFEYEINKKINNQLPVTYEVVENIYIEMMKKYEGLKEKAVEKILKQPNVYALSTILRISHFYVGNFYVYKYAIGQIVALIVADKIYHGDKKAITKYYDFLQSGDSLSPLETIKLLDIDLNINVFYSKITLIISTMINKFKKSTE